MFMKRSRFGGSFRQVTVSVLSSGWAGDIVFRLDHPWVDVSCTQLYSGIGQHSLHSTLHHQIFFPLHVLCHVENGRLMMHLEQ